MINFGAVTLQATALKRELSRHMLFQICTSEKEESMGSIIGKIIVERCFFFCKGDKYLAICTLKCGYVLAMQEGTNWMRINDLLI